MLKFIILKISSIILICLTFCSCYVYGSDTQKNQYSNHNTYFETQEKSENAEKKSVIPLNNEATPFAKNLYIGSIHSGYRVFYNKDKQGAYHNWKMTQDFFSIPSFVNIDHVFRYNDKIVCQYRKENKDSIIAVYDKNLNIQRIGEVEGIFCPEYIYGNLCYGYSFPSEEIVIQAINLDTMDVKKLYSSNAYDRNNVIIDDDGGVVIYKDITESKTSYYKYNEGLLTPIFETKSSRPVCYDARGLFYLEVNGSESEMDLMLWNGQNSRMIESVKIDDMSDWLFANGISGNVIIENDFIVTIHQTAEEPYVLIQQIGSQESEKELLTKWKFSEADRDRYNETFSGVYYEDGKVVNYFFSNKAGMLKTQVIDIKELLKRWGSGAGK